VSQTPLIQHEQKAKMMQTISRGLIWIIRNSIMLLILCLIFIWTFMPILWTFSLSLKGMQELYTMPMRFFPHTPSFNNYRWLVECFPEWPIYVENSIITTLGTVAMTIFCAFLMGYAFARIDFLGRDLIFYLLIAAMFIPQMGLLIAQYELMHALELRNSLWGLALLFASNLSVPVFIMRQTFMSMPGEIEDAARIDGAGRWRLFLAIALPFASSAIVLVIILTFVNIWGEYLVTITMIDDPRLYTLGIGLSMMTGAGARVARGGTTVASYLLASVPAVLLYTMLQDYFVQGLSEGALKL
jgi:ABC-type glycerol-3-phosphate transport system permease component